MTTPMTRRRGGRPLDRAWGMALGMVLDAAVGDPRRFHPVAGFGRAATHLERRLWSDSRGRGTAFTAVAVGAVTVPAALLARRAAASRPATIALTALATWATVGGRSLRAEGDVLRRLLESDDLPAARQRLTHLVSRRTDALSAGDVARAAVESVAENSSDAIVAPLLWGAVAGIPGLVGYRAVNTLDAMVGYRSERYLRFGWASARLDDVANIIPARSTAIAVAACCGRRAGAVWRTTRHFARRHPSPNAGWCEAAYAAALGLKLGGRNSYGDRVEDRPLLGEGAAPTAPDIARATRLTTLVTHTATACAIALAVVMDTAAKRFRLLRRAAPGVQ